MASETQDLNILCRADGLYLDQPPLALESHGNSWMNFISSASDASISGRLTGAQTLASEEAYRILTRRFPRARFLACHYSHPVTLGNLSATLLPSGESAGSAFLHLERGSTSVLYASRWSFDPCPSACAATFLPAETLVLRLHAEVRRHRSSIAKREIDRLFQLADEARASGRTVAIIANPLSETERLGPLLVAHGYQVFCDDRTFRTLRPLHLGNLDPWQPQRLGDTGPEGAIVFIAKGHHPGLKTAFPADALWALAISAEPYPHHMPPQIQLRDSFDIPLGPDEDDLQRLVDAVRPRQVRLCGPGAHSAAQILNKMRISAQILPDASSSELFGI